MTVVDLTTLVKQGEGEQLEFKKSTGQRREAGKTICAFLNGQGGSVLFGITDACEIKGQLVSSRTLEDVAQELKRLDPPAAPGIYTVPLGDETSVIVVTVAGGGGPYSFDGRPYQRIGAVTQVMPREVYEQLLLERLHPVKRWETQPAPDAIGLDDLDAEEIQSVLTNAVNKGRMETPRHTDIESILRGLELIQDNKLLNAAVALFGQNLGVFYPQCEVRLARFRGVDRLPDFTDNRQYKGHAFSLLRRAESFLLDHLPIAGKVTPSRIVREDVPWYPPHALREAVANAICHRDYSIPGGAVAIAMHDDRLEISNPGDLHFGITPEKLKLPHESRPWNPLIANTFYRAGIIERWGSGTTNIVHWCKENGNPSPCWQVRTGSVVVTFYPPKNLKDSKVSASTPQATPQATPQVEKLLQACEEATAREDLQKRLEIKDRKYFRKIFLNPALEAGFIELTIPGKPKSPLQKYRLTDKGRELIQRIKKAEEEDTGSAR